MVSWKRAPRACLATARAGPPLGAILDALVPPPSVIMPCVLLVVLPRLDASTDAPGWRNAHGTHSGRPSRPVSLAADASSQPTGSGDSGTGPSAGGETVGAEPGRGAVSSGEWSAVAKGIRAIAEALIAAEEVCSTRGPAPEHRWFMRGVLSRGLKFVSSSIFISVSVFILMVFIIFRSFRSIFLKILLIL